MEQSKTESQIKLCTGDEHITAKTLSYIFNLPLFQILIGLYKVLAMICPSPVHNPIRNSVLPCSTPRTVPSILNLSDNCKWENCQAWTTKTHRCKVQISYFIVPCPLYTTIK
uniref:Uncharacterized protein n=1 Tax=Micrurus spixii TaxID=129469 RepID=A0A2D4LFX4_9SAUR